MLEALHTRFIECSLLLNEIQSLRQFSHFPVSSSPGAYEVAEAYVHRRVRRVVEAAANAELHSRRNDRCRGDFDLEERQLVEFSQDEGVRADLAHGLGRTDSDGEA